MKPYHIDAQVWFSDINSIQMKIFTSLFLVVMVGHALQGLKAVEDDYFTERTIGMFLPQTKHLAKFLRYSYRGFYRVSNYCAQLRYCFELFNGSLNK